jgi:hypothetical protein
MADVYNGCMGLPFLPIIMARQGLPYLPIIMAREGPS